MTAIVRPTSSSARRTLRSYARNSARQIPVRATEATEDPIVNSDEDSRPKSPITSKMTRKDLHRVRIPETPTKSRPNEGAHSESIAKVSVPSATPTPSPALSPSPERDVVEPTDEKKSDSSDASVVDVTHRVTRSKERKLSTALRRSSSSVSSEPKVATVEKRVTRSRSKHELGKDANNDKRYSQVIPVAEDDDDDVISAPVQPKSRMRLQRNAPTSDDDVHEVDTPPPNNRRRTRSSSDRDKKLPEDPADDLELQAILSNAPDEASVTKMVIEWGTKDGRARLRKLYGSHDEDEEKGRRSTRITRNNAQLNVTGNETESDQEIHHMRKKRRIRKMASASTDESDSEKINFDSPATRARHEASGVRTRRQIASMTNKRRTEKMKSKSMPLPKITLNLLRNNLKSRKGAIPPRAMRSKRFSRSAHGGRSESYVEDRSPPKLRRIKQRPARRRTSSNAVSDENESEVDDERDQRTKNLNDTIQQLSDADDETNEEEVVEMELEEVDGSVASDEDDEDGEVEEIMSDGDEEDDDYESEDAFEENIELKRSRSRRKTNGRRKRTCPRNIFQAQGDALTAREQQERLDFLVQQSATIAKDLHVAMAAQSGKHTDENNVNEQDKSDKTVEDKREEAFVPPTGDNCTLQAHQNEGVKWLLMLDAQGLNAILADEMGLGKTIQTISFLASLVISGSRGPHLVIAPRNVCAHWAEEVKKFYPNQISVVTHLGSADERFENLEHILREDAFDIMVTSYELAARDLFSKKRREGFPSYSGLLRAFRNVEFEYLVIDEAHRLKNDNSKINIGIRAYAKAQRRLLLTGTPLSNNLQELWSLMNVLNPQIFSSKATFETWFSAPFSSKVEKKNAKVSLTAAEKSVIVDRLHTVIRPFFRRRVRADVCPTFTSADEVIIRCPMSSLQKALMLHFQQRVTTKDAGLNNVVMAMRRLSNHPYIVSAALYDNYASQVTPRIVASSGKFTFLYHALPRLLAGDHRVLIFSQFREVLDFLEDLMELLGIKFSRLDGMTTSDARSSGLAEFNREGSDIPVFLLTTRAGGVGLNLQTADTVILFDSDWNPSADLQAVSRIQRIGQKRTVHIIRLVTDRSIDDLIVEAARHKMKTQQVAVGAGKFNTSHGAALDQRMRQRDLEQLLQKLDTINYNEIGCNISGANTGDGDVIPSNDEANIAQQMYMRWDKALLRVGETALPDVSIDPVWIDSVDGCRPTDVPKWLHKDADVWAAAKALVSSGPFAATREYEDALKSKALVGGYSKKGRAARARRQVINYDDFSDLESGDDEKDPELIINDVEIVEDGSDEGSTENGSEEKEKEKSTNKGSSMLQARSKNGINLRDHTLTEHVGSKTEISQASNMRATGSTQVGVASKGGNFDSVLTVGNGNGPCVPPNGVSDTFTKHTSAMPNPSTSGDVSKCRVFQPTSLKSARSVADVSEKSSVVFGIAPSPFQKPRPLNSGSEILDVSESPIQPRQTKGSPQSTAPKLRVNGNANAGISKSSLVRRRGRPKKSRTQDYAAQYVLEYRRLCAPMGISPRPPALQSTDHPPGMETTKLGSTAAEPTETGLPNGLRKISPTSPTTFSFSPSSESNEKKSLNASTSIESNTSSPFGSQNGRAMPTLLKKTVPLRAERSNHTPTPSLTPQSKYPYSRLVNRALCPQPPARNIPQEKVAPGYTGLPRNSASATYRKPTLSRGVHIVNRTEMVARKPEGSNSHCRKVQNRVLKRSLSANRQPSTRERENIEVAAKKRAVENQFRCISRARPEASHKPTPKRATEVVVISDSDDDFEISFSADI